MKKVMVLSNTRTGSTWLCRIVRRLLNQEMGFAQTFAELELELSRDRFVKAHRFNVREVLRAYPDLKVISVVRNPKDRFTSQFHFSGGNKEIFDEVLKRNMNLGEKKQLRRMIRGYSTRAYSRRDTFPNYLWTTYEWMKEDINRETLAISKFLDLPYDEKKIRRITEMAQKESEIFGQIRRGEVNSWEDELGALLDPLDKYQEIYYNRINKEIIKPTLSLNRNDNEKKIVTVADVINSRMPE